MTSPIQAATIAALSSDRCCWKEPTLDAGLPHSRRFTRAFRKIARTRARTLKDLQCKARLILLTTDVPDSMEASLARDVLAFTGGRP
ncbi:hypothetical protein K2X14_00265 [Acetobacter sp. TBRC 12305]|uniref:Uncharacterized protein n=1 Tax=Acetobacter garciniae TaxID=2817435 RepID=A0A939KKU5_9PROT|nr:hypothetical protein [Acetobacter garciniae]MBO1323588.1 hypothetical protein [Acetobacter garciniae]MBX0343277.1 hypothetical protein [Acetobacter garciniae]